MAYWQLGDKEAARNHYEPAVKILSKYEYPPEEVGHWRAEAATLLGIKPDKEIKQEKLEADNNQPKEKPK
jgi:hypothetical protein